MTDHTCVLTVYARTAPLPDAAVPAEPIAKLLCERQEYHEDGRATLSLLYRVIWRASTERGSLSGCFQGGYSRSQNRVSLVSADLSPGFISLDLEGLKGYRIGTYLLNEIVCWAKQWPEASVDPLLLSVQHATPDNRDRRNRFYERFGVRFAYRTEDRFAGESLPMTAADLIPVESWKQNIRVDGVFETLCAQETRLAEEARKRRASDAALAQLKDEYDALSARRLVRLVTRRGRR